MICYCDREEQLLPVSALASYMAVHLVHELESCVRGQHIYKEIWTPVTGGVLACARETVNLHDHFAVKVLRAGVIVGHLPKKISTICSEVQKQMGAMDCGVFAIATATSLLFKVTIAFTQSLARHNFEQLSMQPFP